MRKESKFEQYLRGVSGAAYQEKPKKTKQRIATGDHDSWKLQSIDAAYSKYSPQVTTTDLPILVHGIKL